MQVSPAQADLRIPIELVLKKCLSAAPPLLFKAGGEMQSLRDNHIRHLKEEGVQAWCSVAQGSESGSGSCATGQVG